MKEEIESEEKKKIDKEITNHLCFQAEGFKHRLVRFFEVMKKVHLSSNGIVWQEFHKIFKGDLL